MSHEFSKKKAWGLFLYSLMFCSLHYLEYTMWLDDKVKNSIIRGNQWLSGIRKKQCIMHVRKDQFIIRTYHLNYIRNIVIIWKGRKEIETFQGVGLRKDWYALFIQLLELGHSHTKKTWGINRIGNKYAINHAIIYFCRANHFNVFSK